MSNRNRLTLLVSLPMAKNSTESIEELSKLVLEFIKDAPEHIQNTILTTFVKNISTGKYKRSRHAKFSRKV